MSGESEKNVSAEINAEQSHWLARWIVRRVFTFAPIACIVVRLHRRFIRGWGRKLDVPSESFFVTLPDGQKLSAIHIPSLNPTAKKLPVLMTHGWVEVKEIHFRVAKLLANNGHDVVLFDLRSHGHSSGWRFVFGAVERSDVRAMIEAMQQRNILKEKLILVGYSAGASIMLMYTPTDARVAGVVAYAPYCDFLGALESFRVWLGKIVSESFLSRGAVGVAKQWNLDLRQTSVEEAVKQIDVPTMLLVGDRDRQLPGELHTQKLAKTMAGRDVELLLLPGASHTDICQKNWDGVDEKVLRFLTRVSDRILKK